jgi:penicillin-binding protein 2
MGIDPVPGADVYLTIDSNIQQVGNDAIKQYIKDAANDPDRKPGYKTASAGAFVVMNVKNGEIIGMGSYPDFDPNDFVLAMEGDAQAKEQLEYYLGVGEYLESGATENDLPLWNRAIMSPYTPGSTFKLVTALAALENGIITPNSSLYKCESPVLIAEILWECLERPNGGHGNLTLKAALATSCNIYFQKLGVDTGIDNIDAIGKLLGLGEMTGIDLPGEEPGVRASRQTKYLLHESEFDKLWMPADTAQTAIGQFDNNYTILQLARYTAAIATNQLVTPHVIREVVAEDGTILYSGPTDVIQLDFSEENLEAIRTGMRAVANVQDPNGKWEGTAYKYFKDFEINGKPNQVACKTGTAETGWEDIRHEYSNGLFICYAPADDPQIAIALVVEKGEWGSSTAKIAKKILEAYFEDSGDNEVKPVHPVIGDDLVEATT